MVSAIKNESLYEFLRLNLFKNSSQDRWLTAAQTDVSAESGQAIYDRAEAALAKGDTETAVDLFSSLATRFKKSKNLSKYQLLARYGEALLLNNENTEVAIILDQAREGLMP